MTPPQNASKVIAVGPSRSSVRAGFGFRTLVRCPLHGPPPVPLRGPRPARTQHRQPDPSHPPDPARLRPGHPASTTPAVTRAGSLTTRQGASPKKSASSAKASHTSTTQPVGPSEEPKRAASPAIAVGAKRRRDWKNVNWGALSHRAADPNDERRRVPSTELGVAMPNRPPT